MKSFAYPGNIEPELLAIATGQVPYMRTAWFSGLILECEQLLLELIECPGGRVIPFTASGTAAMESCVVNLAATARKVLVLNGGTFGARWRDLCRYHGVPCDECGVPFGGHPDLPQLQAQLKSGAYDVLLMQHHETSSGYLFDVETIGALCRAHGVRLVVDAIGSFLADALSMARSGMHAVVVSSQKGLNLPPGLSFVVLSQAAVEQARFARRSFYLDWAANLANLARGQTPFSPATHLFMQLQARLRRVRALSVPAALEAVSARADAFRAACAARGWAFSAERRSAALTGVHLPFPARPMVNALAERQVFIMPSGPENMIRVTHTGTLDGAEHLRLVEEIDLWERNERK